MAADTGSWQRTLGGGVLVLYYAWAEIPDRGLRDSCFRLGRGPFKKASARRPCGAATPTSARRTGHDTAEHRHRGGRASWLLSPSIRSSVRSLVRCYARFT